MWSEDTLRHDQEAHERWDRFSRGNGHLGQRVCDQLGSRGVHDVRQELVQLAAQLPLRPTLELRSLALHVGLGNPLGQCLGQGHLVFVITSNRREAVGGVLALKELKLQFPLCGVV
jgi:hypothetical protein